ncbi:MAG: RNA polymerase sigma factor RpoH [Rickettsiales bacterium]|nr:RNA polymerase sigma factor RpoH [Rickettsiales bacterium]
MTAMQLPVLAETGLSRYIADVNRFPLLTEDEEQKLAYAWRDHGDKEAAHKLVTSHLRLVVKIAMGYRGYGLPLVDMISEGNLGLMQAVKKFEPAKGFRLSTYAMWWIRASVQEYILRSWSLVKIGTTAAQKKLFFNLRKLKNRISHAEDRALAPDEIHQIATELNVAEQDVVEMEQRMSATGDHSLNRTIGDDSDQEWIGLLTDERDNHETALVETRHRDYQMSLMLDAMKTLSERERDIIRERRLNEPAATLEELSQKYDVSRERIRQIENRAFEKLQKAVQEAAQAA